MVFSHDDSFLLFAHDIEVFLILLYYVYVWFDQFKLTCLA